MQKVEATCLQTWETPLINIVESINEVSLSGVDGTGDIGHFES